MMSEGSEKNLKSEQNEKKVKSQYAETLNLPQTEFPMRANLPQWEPEQLKAWDAMNLYRLVREKSKGKPKFIFHDGPPYANGDIHMGHALNKSWKDMVTRFATMRGYDSPFVPGFDTHGMPIEHAAIRQLGLKRNEISPLELRQKCEEWARGWIKKQTDAFRRLGIIADWENPYSTFTKSFEAAQLGVFAEFVRKGAIYKGLRPVHWCPTCETALADAEIEYEEHSSPSIYVAFDVAEDPKGVLPKVDLPYSFAIWTTTPWTLPANMGICLGPEMSYVALRTEQRYMIVASELKENFVQACGLEVTDEIGGFVARDLEGMQCRHPFVDRLSLLMLGDHVTLDAGTGCVHTSPGHGHEDFLVSRAYGLPVLNPTDSRGRFTAEGGAYQGMSLDEANVQIIADLKASGHLIGQSQLTHQYPHCWRCHKPVMFRATEQWFASVLSFVDQALAEIDRVQWFPSSGKLRMSNMVKDRGDWCISRQRAWGVPLPIFYCRACGKELMTPESVQVVQELFAEKGSNSWYELEAEQILPQGRFACSCGCNVFVKEKDIMDVWFDAGSSHAAVLEQRSELRWPANIYLEGTDQYRGWFQSSLWTGVIARGRAPYDQVVVNGFTVDSEGRKMSKSRGNTLGPQVIIKQYGADVLRLWALSMDFKNGDMRIGDLMLKQVSDAYRKIRNTMRFLLSNLYDYNPDGMDPKPEDFTVLDQLMLGRLVKLHEKITQSYETYEYHQVYHALYQFCTVDLSAFYLDILKDRLYASVLEDPKRRAAQYVLWHLADCLIRYLTPVLNFSVEAMYVHLPKKKGTQVASALLLDWPEPPQSWFDPVLHKLDEKIIPLRDEINRVIEQERAAKVIGSTLEAQVELFAGEKLYGLFSEYLEDWTSWLIVSKVVLRTLGDQASLGASSTEREDLRVRVTQAPGGKCERCWTYSEDMGKYADHPSLCPRCSEVMQALARA